VEVLRALLRLPNFRTGRLDPAIDHLMKVTGFARATIVRALARLKFHGFLDWVRRSRKTGNDREMGPQRAQTSNAYFFENRMGRLAKGVRQRFLQLLGYREEVARQRAARSPATAAEGPPGPSQAAKAASPELQALLDRLGASVGSASSR
jgi:hypothetical protein